MSEDSALLEGKVALVAGATRGAGRGIAVQLGVAGATVMAPDMEALEPTLARQGYNVRALAELLNTIGCRLM